MNKTAPHSPQQQLLNEHRVAEYLGIAPQTLRAWRMCGRGPRYYKLPAIRYRLSDVERWLESHAVDGAL